MLAHLRARLHLEPSYGDTLTVLSMKCYLFVHVELLHRTTLEQARRLRLPRTYLTGYVVRKYNLLGFAQLPVIRLRDVFHQT